MKNAINFTFICNLFLDLDFYKRFNIFEYVCYLNVIKLNFLPFCFHCFNNYNRIYCNLPMKYKKIEKF